MRDRLLYKIVIPAEAGIHSSASPDTEKWIPAFAVMTFGFEGKD
jgi:hypothetical protein